ncbi:basic salivary proline-rich protein 2-like [Coturnix japonica]|uniref:basic salivary proline-rich protein 2-like n=1 Tax=Coturnix japonica TaxID=93934 RepID=UPI0007776D61|nr:basic salivary proline-rich protein 2-like [Coturnix japonica]
MKPRPLSPASPARPRPPPERSAAVPMEEEEKPPGHEEPTGPGGGGGPKGDPPPEEEGRLRMGDPGGGRLSGPPHDGDVDPPPPLKAMDGVRTAWGATGDAVGKRSLRQRWCWAPCIKGVPVVEGLQGALRQLLGAAG